MTSKTVSQIAEELGVTRQAVHQKLKKNPELQKYTENSHGAIYIKGEGIALLKNTFAKSKKTDDLREFADNDIYLQVESLQSQITAKNNEIELLKQRLEDKDTYIQTLTQQISVKDSQIQKLSDELAQETQHNRDMSEKFAKIADQAQQLNAADKQQIFSVDDKAAEKKPTLWERITGKRKPKE